MGMQIEKEFFSFKGSLRPLIMNYECTLNTAEISRFYFVLFVAAGFSLRTLKGAATMVSGNSNRIQYKIQGQEGKRVQGLKNRPGKDETPGSRGDRQERT